MSHFQLFMFQVDAPPVATPLPLHLEHQLDAAMYAEFDRGDLVWFDPGIGYVLPGEVVEFNKQAQVSGNVSKNPPNFWGCLILNKIFGCLLNVCFVKRG